jgi:hypothetical protein
MCAREEVRGPDALKCSWKNQKLPERTPKNTENPSNSCNF